MIRVVDGIDARLARGRIEIAIAGNVGSFGTQRNEFLARRRAIAIDHQTGVALRHEWRVELARDFLRDTERADIPADMARTFRVWYAEITEGARDGEPSVIAGEYEGCAALRAFDRDRGRLVRREQTAQALPSPLATCSSGCL